MLEGEGQVAYGQQQAPENGLIEELRSRRKVLRSRFTRTVNRLSSGFLSNKHTKYRVENELSVLAADFKEACDDNGQLIESSGDRRGLRGVRD